MEEYGFEVILLKDPRTNLWEKLKEFYEKALETDDEWFVRIDADIIPNRNVIKLSEIPSGLEELKWICASGFDWYSQDRKAISVHLMHRSVIGECYKYIDEARDKIRPETYLWRKESINDLTGIAGAFNCGIHGFAQQDQRNRIQWLKYNRNQDYDWKLLDRIEAL